MPDKLVRVYRPDGSLQCGLGRPRTLKEDQQVLSALGGHVISAEKRTIPVQVLQVCGAPTGRANTYVIKAKEWQLILRSFVGPAGFAEWTYDAPTTSIFKYDGTLQCGLGQEGPLNGRRLYCPNSTARCRTSPTGFSPSHRFLANRWDRQSTLASSPKDRDGRIVGLRRPEACRLARAPCLTASFSDLSLPRR